MIYNPCCSPFSQKTSFRASKWPQKLKTAKNSKLPKLPETCFGPVGEGGWPPISTWITQLEKEIFISQTKYIKEMLNKVQMEDNKLVSTPMVTGCKLSLDDDSPKVDQTMYISMIESLLCATTTRPDIM
jgi:hypothetical protein